MTLQVRAPFVREIFSTFDWSGERLCTSIAATTSCFHNVSLHQSLFTLTARKMSTMIRNDVVTGCTLSFTIHVRARHSVSADERDDGEFVWAEHDHDVERIPFNSPYSECTRTLDCLVPTQKFIRDQIKARLFPEATREGTACPRTMPSPTVAASQIHYSIRNAIGRFETGGGPTAYVGEQGELQADVAILALTSAAEAQLTIRLPPRWTIPVTAWKVSR